MRKLFEILCFVWSLPATLMVWVFYILPLWATGNIKWDGLGSNRYFLIASFITTKKDSWWIDKWQDWAGWSGPYVIIMRKKALGWALSPVLRTWNHEGRHCLQQSRWGVLFYLAYGINVAYLWLFKKDKHAYHDCYFERDARKAAGQLVDIPREQWMHGPNDYWPWWIWVIGLLGPLEEIWNQGFNTVI